MLTITARADCRYCHGSGTVYDVVDYGSTTASMPSDCEDCVEAGWPDGVDGDAEYEIVPAPSVWGEDFGSSQGDLLVTDEEQAQEEAYWREREAELDRKIEEHKAWERDMAESGLLQELDDEEPCDAPTLGNLII